MAYVKASPLTRRFSFRTDHGPAQVGVID